MVHLANTIIDPYSAGPDVTTLTLEGEQYDITWDWAAITRGPIEVSWMPEVLLDDIFSHALSEPLSWEEFQERTLWLYDQERLSVLVWESLIEDARG